MTGEDNDIEFHVRKAEAAARAESATECAKLADQVQRLKTANAEQWQNGADMGAELDQLGTEVERLRERLFQVYVATGEDTDGATSCPPPGCWTPDVPEAALTAVSDLRHTSEVDYDALDAENQRLKADRRALDIAVTGLRELESQFADRRDEAGDRMDDSGHHIAEAYDSALCDVSALLDRIGGTR